MINCSSIIVSAYCLLPAFVAACIIQAKCLWCNPQDHICMFLLCINIVLCSPVSSICHDKIPFYVVMRLTVFLFHPDFSENAEGFYDPRYLNALAEVDPFWYNHFVNSS